MSMELNNISNGAQKFTNQKGEELVIDLGSIDTQSLLMEGNEQSCYTNILSAREMESLTALCDTMVPAVDPPDNTADESVIRFYKTSASMVGTHEHLGRLISQRLRHHVVLIRILLFMLSTRLGTFIFGGGTRSISYRFPFFLKFSELPLEKRQQFILALASHWFFLFRMAFFGVKLLILIAFFTQVDENEDNPSWKVMGYCGPDPDFLFKKRNNESNQQLGYLTPKPNHNSPNTEAQDQPNKEELYGPLNKGIINVKYPQEILVESLKRSGFHVSIKRKKKYHETTPVMTIKCDAVVVGSGSGGGLAAGVLAAAGYKVLVVEKGDYFARTNLSLLEGPTLDHMYEGAGLLSTRDLGVTILAGSTVGGGSTINWSASIRTPPHVIREWVTVNKLEIFDSPLFKEALDVVCEKMGVQSEIGDEGFNNAVLRKGCVELGYPIVNIPRNASADHYCGWCCLGCKDGKKKGTCETWLKDMIDSGNGAVLASCEVKKVLYERKKGRNRDTAKGVMFEIKRDRCLCVVEAKATIVASGALCTPALLKNSGLQNPNIGKNLHLHPVVMAWGYFPDTEPLSSLLSSDDRKMWPEKDKKSYEGGIMTAMSTVVGEFNKSGYGAVIQTPSLHPGLFSALMPWTSGSDIKHRMTKFSRTAHIFALARDIGSGIISTSPYDITYKMDTTDEANLKKGLEKMLRILAAAGAEEIGTHHYRGASINVKKVSYHEFEEFVKKESSKAIQGLSMPISSAHQMGSCKMGVDPKKSVVNHTGETWEVEGLYLADSSVFPTALGVNPMVTIQAISYCTAQSVLEYLKRKKKR